MSSAATTIKHADRGSRTQPLQMETARLTLRPLRADDVTDAYIEAMNDPNVVGLTEARHVTWDRERVTEFIARANQEGVSLLIGMFLQGSGRHIGNVRLFNFHPVHRRAELSFIIFDTSQWSQGYGTEAVNAVVRYGFEGLGLHRIHADYFAGNTASEKLFAKAGFRTEGVYQDHFRLGERYTDSVRVGRVSPSAAEAPRGRSAAVPRPGIPSAGPSITELEVRRVTEAARSGWYANMNREIDEFERRFAEHVGTRHALATSHCTGAIHLALAALGVERGDEVIVPDITWVASAAPICYLGARPVFVDMDPATWCMTPEAFERAITRRTKAVIVVGLLGNMPEMRAIQAIAARHGIPIVEDAAESLGATYEGKPAGSFGRAGVFSFTGTKLMVTGEGGMLVTNDRRLHARCRRLIHHGIVKRPGARYYWSHELGYKYQLSNLQAALGLAQLGRLPELVQMRRLHFRWYEERLKGLEGVQLNAEPESVKSTFWITTAMISRMYGMRKEQVVSALERRGIGGRPFFYPLSSMPTFAPYCRGKQMRRVNPVSYAMAPYGVCLPSSAALSEDDADYVCEQLRRILKGKPRRRGIRSVAAGSAR